MTEGTPEKIDALTERLSAYVDGEVSADEAREIETMLSRNATARRIVAELRALSERVGSLPIERAPGEMKERVLAALERDALLDAGADHPGAPGPRTGWRVFQLVASAALVAIAVGVGYFIYLTVIEPARLGLGDDILVAQRDEPEPRPEALVERSERDESLRGRDQAARRETVRATPPPAPEAAPTGARGGSAGDSPGLGATSARERRSAPQPDGLSGGDEAARSNGLTPVQPADLVVDDAVASAEPEAGFISPASLMNQRLDQVQNQVTIQVADAETEQTVVGNVRDFLAMNSAIDAASLPQEVQLAPTQQLYMLNSIRLADASESNQFLVRANPSVVNSLLANVQAAVPSAEFQQQGPKELFYFDEELARQRRAAGAAASQPQIVGGAFGTAAAAEPAGQAGESGIAPTPGSGVTQSANVPVKVREESEAKQKRAPESAGPEALQRDDAKKESPPAEEAPQQTQPASPMRQLKPDLDERPVLVLLNIERLSPATQSVTSPATQSNQPSIRNE